MGMHSYAHDVGSGVLQPCTAQTRLAMSLKLAKANSEIMKLAAVNDLVSRHYICHNERRTTRSLMPLEAFQRRLGLGVWGDLAQLNPIWGNLDTLSLPHPTSPEMGFFLLTSPNGLGSALWKYLIGF